MNMDMVKRTAEAIANLGYSYLSDSEVEALNDPEFERAVMEEVAKIKGRNSTTREE